MKIGIGIATYRREKKLKKCVYSLQKMNISSDVEICIIIADNEANGTAKKVVDSLRTEIKYPIYYQIAKGRGIPFARNNILKQALNLDIDYLAFIDDDEWVDKNWLLAHWNYMKKSDADVTYGFVETVFPAHTPKWIINGNFQPQNKEMTGKLLNVAYTNNVLFDFKKIVKDWNIYFDESFGLHGGGDTDYFFRVIDKGGVIRNVRQAIVSEELEDNRMNVNYILKRKWRTRNDKKVFNRISNKVKFEILIKSIFWILLFPVIFIISLFINKTKRVKSLIKLVESFATILGLIGVFVKWDEYKK